MPIHIPPAGYLHSAKARVGDALAAIDRCIDQDANHLILQEQADAIAEGLRLAADTVRRALTAAEAEAAIKRAEERDAA